LLKKVELTGVVTLFYSEYCSQKGFIGANDVYRTQIYEHYRQLFSEKKKNPHHLMSMEEIDFQGIINVAYRNYIFDKVINTHIENHGSKEIVNLGCGMDTRYFRLKNFKGEYFDVDFQNVINEKRKLLKKRENYYFINTKSIIEDSFFVKELPLLSETPLFVAEGLFCYIEYENILRVVKKLFEIYPNAVLICDVFLFENHQCFSDFRSKLILRFPEKGELIYKYLDKFSLRPKEQHSSIKDGREFLKGIDLIDVYSSEKIHVEIANGGVIFSPQFWIGEYRRNM